MGDPWAPLTRGDIKRLWWAVARSRAASGDKAGADQARRNARAIPTVKEGRRYGA